MDKLPPQAIELEAAILGICLLEAAARTNVVSTLPVDAFYDTRNKEIYDVIVQLHRKGDNVDILTVFHEIKNRGKQDQINAGQIALLTNNVVSSVNTEYHCAVVLEAWIKRELITIASDIQRMSYDNIDPMLIFNHATTEFDRLQRTEKNNMRHISEVVNDVIKIMERNQRSQSYITGVGTGFEEFDKHSGGLQPGELIVIAGETSQGKTALSMNITLNAATTFRKAVGVFTLEMTDTQLASRAMSMETNVTSKNILQRKMDNLVWSDFINKLSTLVNSSIYINHVASSDKTYIENAIRQAMVKHNLDLIVVDYLQLIRNSQRFKSTADSVAEIANDMKRLAIALNVPIILISQLSRDHNDAKPSITRLKNSGDIENAADVVWLTWRPAYYKKDMGTYTINGVTYEAKNLSHNIIAKGRNIGLTEFPLMFNPYLTKFENWYALSGEIDYEPAPW